MAVNHPSQVIFEQLQSMYPSSLQCPCSSISVPYGSIISIAPVYHTVCSSDFATQGWVVSTYGDFSGPSYSYLNADFHIASQSQFEITATFRQMCAKTVADSWTAFASIELVTSQTLAQDLFLSETNSFVQQTVPNANDQYVFASSSANLSYYSWQSTDDRLSC